MSDCQLATVKLFSFFPNVELISQYCSLPHDQSQGHYHQGHHHHQGHIKATTITTMHGRPSAPPRSPLPGRSRRLCDKASNNTIIFFLMIGISLIVHKNLHYNYPMTRCFGRELSPGLYNIKSIMSPRPRLNKCVYRPTYSNSRLNKHV